jgi:DeoR/GlpR family transcriptional regulator of sugar metabolism
MTSLKANERHQRILSQLNADGRLDVTEMAVALAVSTVTVRADLLYLERAQMLRRIRGGAIATRSSRFEFPVEVNVQLHSAEKRAIAIAAAQYFHPGETVIMDTGSTIAALAAEIPRDLANLGVVTNSLSVAQELTAHPGATVIVTGGTLKPRLNSLISPFGDLILREINADVAFLSCAGVDAEKGFTNANWEEAEIKKAMIRAARRIIFLADHSKIGHIATARIAALNQADLLITDTGVSAERLRELRSAGIEVQVA